MIRRSMAFVSVALLSTAVPILPSTQAVAQEESADRCPAGSSGCTIDNAADRIWDRVREGAEAVLENENPEGRVEEVRDTLNDCMECGFDALDDAFDDFTTDDSPDSSSFSDPDFDGESVVAVDYDSPEF